MWPITLITFLEGVRSRILYGIFIFSLFVMMLSIVFSSFFMQDIGKVAVDLNVSAISFAGLLMSLSLSVNLIAKDLDKKTVYFVLSRPISRTDYIFGKFFGLMLITLFAYILLTLFSCVSLYWLSLQYEGYFDTFKWNAYFQAVYFDYIKICLFNSIIILFSTVTSSSFITMLFSVSMYIVGQTISEVVNYLSINSSGAEISQTVKVVIDTVKYIVPNLEVFDFKVISAHGLLIDSKEFFTVSSYGIIYSLLMLLFACIVFRKKEIL